jgi:hypothetical protein
MRVPEDARLYRLGCGAALIVGPALFFLDNVIHPEDNTYFILSSALLLLAGSWAGFAILRLSDAEFAAGRA